MTNPFTPPPGGFGFGFGPGDRRAFHQQLRQARREFRDNLRDHLREHPAGPGFEANLGFGPGRGFEFGFDPRGGFGFGPGGPRGRGRGGRGRGKRGDVRAAILKLLVERPMHGYEMIQEIAERSQNLWRPSPGSVYPTLQLLVDEGLLVARESEGSKKLFELTDEGRAAADKIETPPWQEIADGVEPGHVNLRSAVAQLMGAVAQSAHTAPTTSSRSTSSTSSTTPAARSTKSSASPNNRRFRRGLVSLSISLSVTNRAEVITCGIADLSPWQFTVGRVGFGAMQLPGPGVLGPPRDHDQALAVLRRAIELGINHIDTAQFYGPNVANELIREALHPYPDNLALVSKVGGDRDEQGNWLPAEQPDDLRRGIEDNLRTLEADRLAAVNLRVMGSGRRPQLPWRGGPRAVRPSALRDDQGPRRRADRRDRAEQHQPRASSDRIGPHRDRLRPKRLQLDRPTSQPVLDAVSSTASHSCRSSRLGSAFTADNPALGYPAVRGEAAGSAAPRRRSRSRGHFRWHPTCC